MSLSCDHVSDHKELKGSDQFEKIYSVFVACSTPSERKQKLERGFCHYCKTRSHMLHACLDCIYVGCFDEENLNHLGKNHMEAHFDDTNHFLAVDITFGYVYCFICEDYMYEELKNESDKQHTVSLFWQPNQEEFNFYKKYVKEDMDNSKFMVLNSKFLGLRGLVNFGQTCYMNCIVQVLIHNPLLKNYFLSDKHNKYTCHFEFDCSSCLVCEVDALFQEFYSGKTTPYDPLNLFFWWLEVKKDDEHRYKAQDAHEFFIKVMETLHIHSKGNEEKCQCIVHKIFTGFLQTTILCKNCYNVRTKVEEFRDICLDLGVTYGCGTGSEEISLYGCLNRYTQSEQIHSICDSCQQQSSSKLQLTIQKLPVIISFQFKRLEKNRKISTFVSFPEYLNMTPFVTSVRGISSETNGEYHYSSLNRDNSYCLFAVVVHTGNMEGGHYISFVKRKQKWYKCDDDIITLACISDVLKSEGYLLFYHKEVLEFKEE